MSRRLNLYGFSLARMRRLCGSSDLSAIAQLCERIGVDFGYLPAERREQIAAVVEQAIVRGVPFPDLPAETTVHACAAGLLAGYEQEWLITGASMFDASALEEGLWGQHRKRASPEARAFLRGLIEGIPMFGRQPPADGSAYAAVALDRLRVFQPHLRELAEMIAYQVGRKRSATDEDRAGAAFAAELCGWVEEVVAADRDMWFMVD